MPKLKRKSEEQRCYVKSERIKRMRDDKDRRELEREKDLESKRLARENKERRAVEKQRDMESKRLAREDKERRAAEKQRDMELKRLAREDKDRRELEREKDLESKRLARENKERREVEKQRDAESRRLVREDKERRAAEKQRDMELKRLAREDKERRILERERGRETKRMAREDEERRILERERDRKTKRMAREDEERRQVENTRNANAMRKARGIPGYHDNELKLQRMNHKRHQSTFECLLFEYVVAVKEGPTYACSSCGGLWYRKSVTQCTVAQLRSKGYPENIMLAIFNLGQADKEYFFCSTCWRSVNNKTPKIPKLCLSNGFSFPIIPSELEDLTPLEERLVALRLPFAQIRSLGVDKQSGMKGNVVNVMNDLDTTAKVLPRRFDESSTVQVMLMRRMGYKTPCMYEVVRPKKVYDAAKYLANTELYKSEGVVLSESWANSNDTDLEDFIVEQDDKHLVGELQAEQSVPAKDIVTNDEIDDQIQQETLVLTDAERSGLIHRIAPGEGKRPMSLLRDLDAEILSYPTIYAGIRRVFDPSLKISYTDISKSEARRFDRRCCGSSKVLYAYKLSQNLRVAAAIQLCLRKKKGGKEITAGELRSETYVSKLVQHDDGYRMLKGIRGSPAYWEGQLKKVMAMLRQLGIPTFFMTLSAAETKWPELLVILTYLLRGETITEQEAMNLSFMEKSDLIRNDPITCARNFDHRLRSLLNILLKKPGGVFALHRLVDYFLRDEFQQRGSPHNHGLYWLENAPLFVECDPSSIPKCTEFIDKYITCERKETDGMENVIQYQIHKHSHTCKKYKDNEEYCRFGFPVPPMKSTTILFPLPEDTETPLVRTARKNFTDLKQFLTGLGRNYKEDMSFESLLSKIGLNENDYLTCLRSSIKRPTVFYKRAVNSIFVNPYNETILKAWRANMDIQFILDPYSCAKYCVSYLAKDDSGVSKLLRKVNEECRQGNTNVKDRLRKFANTFTNFVEISAQEAAYGLLGMPLIRSSVLTEYINTSPPEERVFLVKSDEELKRLPEESTDISVDGVLSRYAVRPKELHGTCLADYVALYNYSKTKKGAAEVTEDDDHDDLVNETHLDDTNNTWIKTGGGWLKKRTRPKIIRYRRYGELKDPENFYREMVMLYVPWFSEESDVLEQVPHELYIKNKDLIDEKRKFYDKNGFSEDVNEYLNVDEDEAEETMDDDTKIVAEDNKTDIFQDIGLVDQNSKFDYIKAPKLIPDEEYWEMIRTLNEKQRRFFLHTVHKLKTNQLPFYELLHGGAGVGKSRVIFSLVQTIARIYAKVPGYCPDDVVVLVAAFTGKAACNVFGLTLHSAFRLPNSQNTGDIVRLVDDVCNTLRSKLLQLRLIIIDEISMVSVKQLFQIDARLRQVFQNELPFGGISILAVGHFRQLKPVMARYIFEVPKFKVMGHLTGNTLWPLFKFYELTEIMRQKGQIEFCLALNNMAEGTMSDEDVALIKAREISDELIPPPNATRLFYSNADCHQFNMEFHSKLGTEQAISTAIDRVQGKCTEQQKLKLLEHAKNLKAGDADGLPYKVHLQIGADFFVSTNIDVSDGLFNGCTGTLMKIEYGVTSLNIRVPIKAWMNFVIPFFGANARSRTYAHQLQHNIDLSWTAIDMDTRVLSRTQRHRHQIVRKQIPLVEANAITIHKSQSSSMELVVVCVKKKMSRELLYVACSRATNYHGLYIDGDFIPPSPPLPADPVALEMERLRSNPVEWSLRMLQDAEDSQFTMIFHNVQSLHKHHKDILSDSCYSSADVMAFVEPWTLPGESYEFPEYKCIHRTDCTGKRNSTGSIVLTKLDVVTEEVSHSWNTQHDGHHSFTTWRIGHMVSLLIYRSPNSSIAEFYKDLIYHLQGLSQNYLVVVGDFNIDLMKPEGKKLATTFSKYGLRSKLPEKCITTDGGTQIDCCFSNAFNVMAWTYESVFSYHKPICVTWTVAEVFDTGLMRTEVETIASEEIVKTDGTYGILEEEFRPMIHSVKELHMSYTFENLSNEADKIMIELNSALYERSEITSISSCLIQHANLIQEITLFLSTSELQIYSNQMKDDRSTLLLPHPMLTQYTPVYTPSDGNCFYNAVAMSIFGDCKYHLLVRLTILNEIVTHEDDYSEFLNKSMAQYTYEYLVKKTMKIGSWADSTIMFVASKVCRRPIFSYDMEFGGLQNVTDSFEFRMRLETPLKGDTGHHKYLFHDKDESNRPICLHYRNMMHGGVKNHFVALLPSSSISTIFPCRLDVYRSLRSPESP